jgi:rsbT co-antagonist protein RsbR
MVDPADDGSSGSSDAYSSLVDACPDMLSAHRSNSSFVLASPAAFPLLGWSPEELKGQELFTLVHDQDRTAFEERWNRVLVHGAPSSIQCRLRRADAGYVWAEVRLRPAQAAQAPRAQSPALPALPTLDGGASSAERERRIYCAVREAMAHPPSEFAYSEPETVEQAARHRDFLVGMLPALVWYCRVRPDLSFFPASYMTRYLEQMAGYSPEHWVSTPGFWASLILPEEKERVLEATARAIRGEGSVPPYRLKGGDGGILWLQSALAIERSPDGTPVTMYGMSLDITRFKEAEAQINELRERERVLYERLEALIASVPGVVWEQRRESGSGGAIEAAFCSDHIERVTGYSASEWRALAFGWLDMAPEPGRAALAEEWQAAWTREASVIRHRVTARDGQLRWVEQHVRVAEGPAGGGRCMRGIAIDITDRVRIEEERERLSLENEHQAIRILELSTPFIPVSDGVVVMPLIGTLNAARAEQLLATLLGGLEGTHAEVAVIDVTGVPTLDRGSAGLLGRAAHAARLLGARTFLTGVRPEVARALIDLDVDLHGIEMRGSLKNALRELLRATRRRR